MSQVPRFMYRGGIAKANGRHKPHGSHLPWYKTRYDQRLPWGVQRFTETPRILLDRQLWRFKWVTSNNLPDANRWERVINGERVTEDRMAFVEEDGEEHAVSWKVYCERVGRELQDAVDAIPQYTQVLSGVPISWKKLDIATAIARGMSVREAKVQLKMKSGKAHQIIYRAVELAETNAVSYKGLERDKLRIARIVCHRAKTDDQIDIRSKGYFAWKAKRTSTLVVTVAEDPDMILPDRTKLPWWVQERLGRHNVATEPTVLDVPAITAEGI
eukprot:PhF_6_TR37819/c0_g1_i1/m.56309/K02890/RP-L22, MRPL22, rplV; large subunit ribosomal protein L22